MLLQLVLSNDSSMFSSNLHALALASWPPLILSLQ